VFASSVRVGGGNSAWLGAPYLLAALLLLTALLLGARVLPRARTQAA